MDRMMGLLDMVLMVSLQLLVDPPVTLTFPILLSTFSTPTFFFFFFSFDWVLTGTLTHLRLNSMLPKSQVNGRGSPYLYFSFSRLQWNCEGWLSGIIQTPHWNPSAESEDTPVSSVLRGRADARAGRTHTLWRWELNETSQILRQATVPHSDCLLSTSK